MKRTDVHSSTEILEWLRSRLISVLLFGVVRCPCVRTTWLTTGKPYHDPLCRKSICLVTLKPNSFHLTVVSLLRILNLFVAFLCHIVWTSFKAYCNVTISQTSVLRQLLTISDKRCIVGLLQSECRVLSMFKKTNLFLNIVYIHNIWNCNFWNGIK